MVIAVRITSYFGDDRHKDHELLGCDRRNDHRGIEDTELLDIVIEGVLD